MPRNSSCTKCSLYSSQSNTCIWGSGNSQASVMIIGKDIATFRGFNKDKLVELLDEGKIDKDLIYTTSLMKCHSMFGPGLDNNITQDQRGACIDYLKEEIQAVNPKVIVALGSDVLKVLTGEDTIMKLAGTVINIDNSTLGWKGKVYVTVPPSYLIHNPSYIPRARRHFEEIGYYFRGTEPPKKGANTTYKFITSFNQVAPFFKALNRQTLVAFDTETDSLDFVTGNLLCFSFSWKERTGIVLPLCGYKKEDIWTIEELKVIWGYLFETFSNAHIEWIAHNLSFDHKYILKYGTDLKGGLHDTMLLQQVLDENAQDLKGLKALAATYTDMGRYDDPLDDFKLKLKAEKRKKLSALKKECTNKLKIITKVLTKDPLDSAAQADKKIVTTELDVLNELKIDITYDLIPTDILWPYAAMDADATFRIYNRHISTLNAQSLYFQKYSHKSMMRLYQKLIMPLRRVLDEMEFIGAPMDRPYLHTLDAKYTKKTTELTDAFMKLPTVSIVEKILLKKAQKKAEEKWTALKSVEDWHNYQKAPDSWTSKIPRPPKFKTATAYGKYYGKPVPFNLNSSSHLSIFLFDVLKCSTVGVERTKKDGKLSTNKDTLEMFGNQKGVDILLENKKIAKLHSTYVKGSLSKLDANDRIHTNFNQHIAVTGRLSSSKPNLQNIPRFNKDIKRSFITRSGWKIVQMDYAQAEFRMWCQLSGDVDMRNDIIAGLDIHTQTASDFWGIPMNRVTKEQRNAAKFVVFGLMYGRGASSVAKQVGISIMDAESIKKKFFAKYPKAANWLKVTQALARRNQFVTGFFGRVRRLPHAGPKSPQNKIAEAMRQAVNSPIQGSAADVTGVALIRIHKELNKRGLVEDAHLILTVHDSIILEVNEMKIDEVVDLCKSCMMDPIPGMHVPFIADVEVGDNWADVVSWNDYKKGIKI